MGPTIIRRAHRTPVREDFRCVATLQRTVRNGFDDMPLFAGLLTAPDGAKLVGILGAHFGSLSEGEAA